MGNIFISYAHEDKKSVLEIYEALTNEGFSTWIDEKNLLPGQDWKIEIEKAIRKSDVFIACLSKHSVNKKGYVQAELKKALDIADLMPEGQVYIIPVRLDVCEVPLSLNKWQWLDYYEVGGKEKLLTTIRSHIGFSENAQIRDEQLFDAGERLKSVREELDLRTSQFIELTDISSQREYEMIESRQKEVPLKLLKKISEMSGVNIEWLKHEKGSRYSVKYLHLNPIQEDLNYCKKLKPQEYFLTLDKKSLHVGLIVQTKKYVYQTLDFGLALDFWNWVESFWSITAFYTFLEELSGPWHDIDGVLLPARYDKQLFNGDIHFLSALRNAERRGGDLLYDLLDINNERIGRVPLSKTYSDDWMDKVHDYFRRYLQEENNKNKSLQGKKLPETDQVDGSPLDSLENEFELALRGTYDAARAHGYVATYFLKMLEEHGGVETAKRLLVKSEPQTGLFELWKLGILHESMEAVICDNPRFHPLFNEAEIAESRRRLEELEYFDKGKL